MATASVLLKVNPLKLKQRFPNQLPSIRHRRNFACFIKQPNLNAKCRVSSSTTAKNGVFKCFLMKQKQPSSSHEFTENSPNPLEVIADAVMNALKSLRKPVIAAVLIGVLLMCNPYNLAMAASGGRMGGRSFSSSSSSKSSSSKSSSSKSSSSKSSSSKSSSPKSSSSKSSSSKSSSPKSSSPKSSSSKSYSTSSSVKVLHDILRLGGGGGGGGGGVVGVGGGDVGVGGGCGGGGGVGGGDVGVGVGGGDVGVGVGVGVGGGDVGVGGGGGVGGGDVGVGVGGGDVGVGGGGGGGGGVGGGDVGVGVGGGDVGVGGGGGVGGGDVGVGVGGGDVGVGVGVGVGGGDVGVRVGRGDVGVGVVFYPLFTCLVVIVGWCYWKNCKGGATGKTTVLKLTVLKLQVGLLGLGRSVQRDLNRIADVADTSTQKGLCKVLTETILVLLRHPDYCFSGCSSVDVMPSLEDGEERFDQLSIEERGKFDEETLVNVDNIKRQSTSSQRPSGFSNEYLVVTILVAAEGVHELPSINGGGDLKEALQKLESIRSSRIKAVEVLWTPQDENDTLSEQKFLEDYPLLTSF